MCLPSRVANLVAPPPTCRTASLRVFSTLKMQPNTRTWRPCWRAVCRAERAGRPRSRGSAHAPEAAASEVGLRNHPKPYWVRYEVLTDLVATFSVDAAVSKYDFQTCYLACDTTSLLLWYNCWPRCFRACASVVLHQWWPSELHRWPSRWDHGKDCEVSHSGAQPADATSREETIPSQPKITWVISDACARSVRPRP